MDGGETTGEAVRPDVAKPLLDAPQTLAAGIAMWVAVLLPLVGLVVAIPVGWGWACPSWICSWPRSATW